MKILIILLLLTINSQAYTLDQWANAIRKAEGNANYGILKHYKHTSYRQACKNTVWHNWLRYKRSGEKIPFIDYLGNVYCPVGAFNDPQGFNRNWKTNVNYFLTRGM